MGQRKHQTSTPIISTHRQLNSSRLSAAISGSSVFSTTNCCSSRSCCCCCCFCCCSSSSSSSSSSCSSSSCERCEDGETCAPHTDVLCSVGMTTTTTGGAVDLVGCARELDALAIVTEGEGARSGRGRGRGRERTWNTVCVCRYVCICMYVCVCVGGMRER
jgi:hypothetical protein